MLLMKLVTGRAKDGDAAATQVVDEGASSRREMCGDCDHYTDRINRETLKTYPCLLRPDETVCKWRARLRTGESAGDGCLWNVGNSQ